MIKKFDNFDIIEESIIIYSNDFIKILNKMYNDNRIAKILVDNNLKDIEGLSSNFFDMGKDESILTMASDAKIQKELQSGNVKVDYDGNFFITGYSTNNVDNYLKSDFYKELFDFFGVFNSDITYGGRTIKDATLVNIHTMNDVIYCLIKYDEKYIITKIENLDIKLWDKYRQDIKIGRGIRSILNKLDIEYTDKEIEDFVNLYKSLYGISLNALDSFRLVKGDEIKYWYLSDNYYDSKKGQLGNSCMRYSRCQNYFQIYIDNCELLIYTGLLKGEEKLLGRAIVWKDSKGRKIMDRVYTLKDSDILLFHEYSKINNILKAEDALDEKITLVDYLSSYDQFPYLDTFSYGYDNMLTGHSSRYTEYVFNDTDGGYSSPDCSTCNGDGRVNCSECNGNGEVSCDDCYGNGEVECDKCDGDGKITEECPECGGSGEVESEDSEDGEMEICSKCDGDGTIDEECDKCDGDGNVECETCHGSRYQECETCYGSGDEECNDCYGTGRIDG